MTRSQKSVAYWVGGAVVVGAGLLYLAMRSAKAASLGDGSGPTPKPPLPSELPDDTLFDITASTEDGVSRDAVIIIGVPINGRMGWAVWRRSSGGEPNLNPGSVVRLALIPYVNYSKGSTDGTKHFTAQITKAYKFPTFTLYEARWLELPTGEDPQRQLAFTSADVISVVTRV